MKLDELCHSNRGFLEAGDLYSAARIVLLGVPLDLTSSYRQGSREAPPGSAGCIPGVGGL